MSNSETSDSGNVSIPTDDPGPGAVEDLDTGDNLGAGDNVSGDQAPEQAPIDVPNYVDPAILPLLVPMYQLLRNPPVAVNNWADPDEDEAS
ncbi:hypothetical protein FRC10_012281 [Ceratobasidium sp. 414]|nr:hypothetical protein FRC10_012281 [Ceratobasidium sp. 414]